jgi:hypothetical protein
MSSLARELPKDQYRMYLRRGIAKERMPAGSYERLTGETSGPVMKAKTQPGVAKFFVSENRTVTLTNIYFGVCECKGVTLLTHEDPRFFCFACLNAANQGLPRPVDFSEVDNGAE